MSQILIHKLLGQEILKVRSKTIQETIYSITAGVQSVVIGVIGSALLLFADVFLILAFTTSLFIIDTSVALLSLLLFAGAGLLLYIYMHDKAEKLGTQATRAEIYSGQKIYEVISCYREITVKNRRNYYAKEIGSLRMTISEAQAGMGILSQISKYIMEITLVAGCIAVGALQFVTQPAARAVAVISVFLISSARIAPAVLRVQTGIVSIRTSIAVSKPTLDLIHEVGEDLSTAVTEGLNFSSRDDFKHRGFVPQIELRDVNFRYPLKSRDTLKDISLLVEPGQFVGIVGLSGSGKSTLTDLILGMLKPNSGQVRISGKVPSEAINTWPGAIAYVPQEVNIVSGTIKDNVCLGYDAKSFNDWEIESLLKQVQLSDLLELPDGIHSDTGERGSKLSGGQRQRIGIARALFTKPRLLILDEATSALDATTESNIVSYFNSLKRDITLIVVAHRLSTIKNADKVIYLKSGRIIGQNKFKTLIKNIPELRKQAKYMGIKVK
jgi:ABC-type multidrug transport system fused ATPase/permease subunit